MSSGDGDGFCAAMTDDGAEQLGAVSVGGKVAKDDSAKAACGRNVLAVRRGYGKGALEQAAGVDVGDVQIDGDRATARIAFSQGTKGSIELVLVGPDWKLPGMTIVMPRHRTRSPGASRRAQPIRTSRR